MASRIRTIQRLITSVAVTLAATPVLAGEPDSDGDGMFDAADVCPGFDDAVDPDGAGIPTGCDNCPMDSNADQRDSEVTDSSLSPVLALRMEDGSGPTVTDEVSTWDGAISGATWTAGRQGGGLDFADNNPSNNHHVNIGDVPELSNVSQFTIAFWFRRVSDRTGDANRTNHNIDNVMVAKSAASTNDNIEIGSTGNSIKIYLDTALLDTGSPYTVPNVVYDGIWTHFALTYDASRADEAMIYINGALEVAVSQWGGTPPRVQTFAFGNWSRLWPAEHRGRLTRPQPATPSQPLTPRVNT